MGEWLLHSIAWLTARHIAHYEAMQTLVARIGSWGMARANGPLFMYYAQTQQQAAELHELKALSAALEIKGIHTDEITGETDWPDHAAIGLNMVAGVLIEQHDWEPDVVHALISDLSDGLFSFHEVEEED